MKQNNLSNIHETSFDKTDININDTANEYQLPNLGNSFNLEFNLEEIGEITKFMKKSICKIDCKGLKGSGFLCKIKISNSKSINALITCNHVLNKNQIKEGDKINISFNNEKLKCIITINESTIVYTNEESDITIIEITGFGCKKYFLCLKIDLKYLKIDDNLVGVNPKDIYKDKEIVVFHYKGGEEVNYSIGKLNNIISEFFFHCCTTEGGSSGSPILMLKNNKVIGIHLGGYEKKKEKEKSKIGTFIKKPIDDFIKKYKSDSRNNPLKNKKISNIEKVLTCKDK